VLAGGVSDVAKKNGNKPKLVAGAFSSVVLLPERLVPEA